jgi:hypothetical protein
MRTIRKYVLVTKDGNWLDMSTDLGVILSIEEKYPNTHIEIWDFEVDKEGTHSCPSKSKLHDSDN